MENAFFAILSRMKYINRWGLMNSTRYETLSEHSLEVAMIAHALAVIGNKRFNKTYNEARVALIALFHDTSEILTGDLPTPVKYKNPDIKSAYKKIEEDACGQLIATLPDDLKDTYRDIMTRSDADTGLFRLVKAADKLSALIKCIEEKKFGNTEFDSAYDSTLGILKELDCPEANLFLEEFIPLYSLNLDQQSN